MPSLSTSTTIRVELRVAKTRTIAAPLNIKISSSSNIFNDDKSAATTRNFAAIPALKRATPRSRRSPDKVLSGGDDSVGVHRGIVPNEKSVSTTDVSDKMVKIVSPASEVKVLSPSPRWCGW
jgi:hypothetical protein